MASAGLLNGQLIKNPGVGVIRGVGRGGGSLTSSQRRRKKSGDETQKDMRQTATAGRRPGHRAVVAGRKAPQRRGAAHRGAEPPAPQQVLPHPVPGRCAGGGPPNPNRNTHLQRGDSFTQNTSIFETTSPTATLPPSEK